MSELHKKLAGLAEVNQQIIKEAALAKEASVFNVRAHAEKGVALQCKFNNLAIKLISELVVNNGQ